MLYIDESQLSRYIFTDVSFGEGPNFLLIVCPPAMWYLLRTRNCWEKIWPMTRFYQQITAHRQAGENNFLCELNGVDTLTIFKYNTTY